MAIHWLVKLVAAEGFRAWMRRRKEKLMTKGMKSSEFWLSIGTFIAAWIARRFDAELPMEAVAAVIAYVISRGVAKLANR